MYNTNTKTIPHDQQRYDTIGDYWTEGGCIQIRVSSMGNADYEFLVAMHELIEKQLCRKLGITEQTIDAWDLAHEDEEEPGAMEDCPYREAHMIAEGFEHALAVKLGVDWDHYSKSITAIMEKTRTPLDPTVPDNGQLPQHRHPGNRNKQAQGKIRERSILRGK